MAEAMRDPDALAALVEPHRRELLGEWKGLSGFEGRSSLRSWLHASCGNAMRAQQFGVHSSVCSTDGEPSRRRVVVRGYPS